MRSSNGCLYGLNDMLCVMTMWSSSSCDTSSPILMMYVPVDLYGITSKLIDDHSPAILSSACARHHHHHLHRHQLVVAVVSCRGWSISQPPRAEAVSRPSAQPVSTQRRMRVCVCVCVCVYRHKAEVFAYACAYAWVVSSLCPVYFSSPVTLRLPSTTLAIPSQLTHTGRGVSRPVKSRFYRHRGRTDSTNRCCYECCQRSQFTKDNAEPFFLPGINSLCQFTVPPNHLQVACANHTYVGEAHDSVIS